ncbi:MAG: Dabb family protein [Bernardetiaceae bacterium]|nr:Dabb family protein [Bernardetiaceae bacterium]
MLRHVVIFKFKDAATPAQIKTVEDAFRALPGKIKQIKAFEWGTNNSPENLAQGFTHCFLVSFASEQDRAAYLPHPDHAAFVEVLKPHLDKALVIDYWAAK